MPKKVTIGKKPTSKVEQMEEWVSNRDLEEVKQESPPAKVKMKRLTLDLSEELHKAIKLKSVQEGIPMADLLRELLQQHFCK